MGEVVMHSGIEVGVRLPGPGPEFHVGESVVKKTGYEYPGEIRAAFQNKNGDWRYVVECTVPEVAGMLHIFNGTQLLYTGDQE
jgi:hypothetical protein